jgi:thiol-disulfide isomerase/thioredoxin
MKQLAFHAILAVGWCLAAASPPPAGAAQGDEREWRLADGTPVTVTVHPAGGRIALLWLPAGFGRASADEARLAEELVAQAIEVWRPALLEARFLPPLESSLDTIPAADVAQLIEAVHEVSKKPVIVLAEARAGLLALRAAVHWRAQQTAATGALRGLVLLYPNLFLGPPEPGTQAAYHPAVAQVPVPVFLIQPALSPWRWRLDETVRALGRGGASVYAQLLPEVRDRFYFRPDATVREGIEAQRLARHIARAAARLLRTPAPAVEAAAAVRPLAGSPAASATAADAATASVGRRGLNPYRGDPVPPTALRLRDLEGRWHAIDRHRGEVLLVNFWASWCPPCVNEMPSMQRLKKKMAGRPFTILAVNMGEDEAAIRAFLEEKASVDFPILLDRDGAALRAWKVFVFPTSFLLGRDGRIRYAAFGALEWDEAEAVATIETLLAE